MKTAILIAAFAAGGLALALPRAGQEGPPRAAAPETVTIAPGTYQYRPAGQYRVGNRAVDPPLQTRHADRPLEIMKYPVSRADYARCVADGACEAAPGPTGEGLPQTDVSWYDAVAYAEWLSEATGEPWRLPTDAEWARAAAERYVSDGVRENGDDPAARWLAAYGQNTALRLDPDLEIRPIGSHGENANGVVDMSGNVWEWTGTCSVKVGLGEDGGQLHRSEHCGVRVAQGQHLAEIVDFVRDAKRGGCAVGLPPDYLGFRLVRAGG